MRQQFRILSRLILMLSYALTTVVASAKTHQIEIKFNDFMPHFVYIHQGDEVEWKHHSTLIHTVTSAVNGAGLIVESADFSAYSVKPFDSGIMLNGESFRHTFLVPGLYLYFCSIHPQNMSGYIRVLEKQ